MRRYAMAGSQADLAACAKLLRLAPGPEHTKRLMAGFETALAGRAVPNLPDELVEALARYGGKSVVLGVRQGDAQAVQEALATLGDPKGDKTQQIEYVHLFAEVVQPASVPVLLKIIRDSSDDALRGAALVALQKYTDPEVARTVLDTYGKFTDDVRAAAQTLLASRTAWTLELLRAVAAGKIDRTSLPLDVLQKLQLHRDERIAELIGKIWGEVRPATTEELRAEIDRFESVVRAGPGSPAAGKKLFMAQCGKCHRLFGEGGEVGPDLTTYKRDDLPIMLLNIVNPNAEIREGFETYLVATSDGRTLAGFLVDQNNRLVILRGGDGQSVVIPRSEIDEMAVTRSSIMPENQLKQYNDQQIRDLFAYLRSSQPLNE